MCWNEKRTCKNCGSEFYPEKIKIRSGPGSEKVHNVYWVMCDECSEEFPDLAETYHEDLIARAYEHESGGL